MSTQNDKEDTAYNRSVLEAIASFRAALEHQRDMVLRVVGLLNTDVVALIKKVTKIESRIDAIDKRQEQIRMVVFIGIGVIIGAVIVLAVVVYLALKKA